MDAIEIDGEGLSVEDLVRIGYEHVKVKIAEHAWGKVTQGRKVIDDILTFILFIDVYSLCNIIRILITYHVMKLLLN